MSMPLNSVANFTKKNYDIGKLWKEIDVIFKIKILFSIEIT